MHAMATYLLVEQCDFHATHIVSERSTGTFGITGFRKAVCEIQVVELDIIVAKPVVVTGTCTSTTSATPRHGLQASTGDRGPTIAPHPVFGQALAWTLGSRLHAQACFVHRSRLLRVATASCTAQVATHKFWREAN